MDVGMKSPEVQESEVDKLLRFIIEEVEISKDLAAQIEKNLCLILAPADSAVPGVSQEKLVITCPLSDALSQRLDKLKYLNVGLRDIRDRIRL